MMSNAIIYPTLIQGVGQLFPPVINTEVQMDAIIYSTLITADGYLISPYIYNTQNLIVATTLITGYGYLLPPEIILISDSTVYPICLSAIGSLFNTNIVTSILPVDIEQSYYKIAKMDSKYI